MPKSMVIWADDAEDLVIKLSCEPTPDVIRLLDDTVWGNRALLYRIRDIAAKLERISDPYFFLLEKAGTLAAVCILNRKKVLLQGVPFDTFHIVMMAAGETMKGRGLAGLLSRQIRSYCETELGSPGVAYAYIESGSDFSIRISDRVGHKYAASVSLTVLSRFRPADDRRVRGICGDEVQSIVKDLYDLYEDHEFLDFERSLFPDEYYVLGEDGRILAGAQAEMLNWSVLNMAGWSGYLVIKVMPYLPVLRNVFRAEDLRFLRFGNIYVRPGNEAELIALLEALLARNDVHVGLLIMDRRSPVLQRLLAFGKFGMINAAFKGTVKVVADFKGASEEDIARICARPMVVSSLDVI